MKYIVRNTKLQERCEMISFYEIYELEYFQILIDPFFFSSLPINRDGKPYIHRRPLPPEAMHACMNPAIASHRTAVRPLAQASKERIRTPEPMSNSKLIQASTPLDAAILFQKLAELKNNLEGESLHRILSDKLSSAQPRELPPIEDDDQSILDHHVSRVFSPNATPGNESPRHLHKNHHRSNEMSNSMPDFGELTTQYDRAIQSLFLLGNYSLSINKILFLLVQLLNRKCDIRDRFQSIHQLRRWSVIQEPDITICKGGLHKTLIAESIVYMQLLAHTDKNQCM